MAETNLKQRERMKPSEKIMAYALEAEALTSQGKLTGTTKRAELSKMFGESGKQVERYLHLSKLAPPLLRLLDQRKLSQKDGLALAKLPKEKQMEEYEHFEKRKQSGEDTPPNKVLLDLSLFPGDLDAEQIHKLFNEFILLTLKNRRLEQAKYIACELIHHINTIKKHRGLKIWIGDFSNSSAALWEQLKIEKCLEGVLGFIVVDDANAADVQIYCKDN